MSTAWVVQGDTLRIAKFYLQNNGVAIDLTNRSAVVTYRIGSGVQKTKTLNIADPLLGIATLSPATDNWDSAGIARGRVEVMDPDGKIGFTRKFTLPVEAQ